jgi:hypothetical protein
MSRKKIFTMAIDNWTNEVLSEAARVFEISKSQIVHHILSLKVMKEIEEMTKDASVLKWGKVIRGEKTRDYQVSYRNFHRYLLGLPPEDFTCEEFLQENKKQLKKHLKKGGSI